MPYGPFGFLATRGLSLFSNQNTKLGFVGIIRGHIGMRLDRIGPWQSLELPYGPFGFFATRGLSLSIKANLHKWPFRLSKGVIFE